METLHTFAAPQAELLWRSVETATPRSPHGSRSREHTVTPTLMVENCIIGARYWNPNGPARASWATLAAIKWFMSARPVHVVKNTHQRLGLACIAAPKFKVWHCNRGASFKNWHKISRALHTFTPCLAKLVWRVLWRAPHFFIPSGKCAVENSSKSVENVPLVWNLKHCARVND